MLKVLSLCLVVFCFQFFAFSQLKKKKLGTYEGVIPRYELNTGFKQIEVDETPISITLFVDSIQMQIGNQAFSGTYVVVLETREYTVLEGRMKNQTAVERILVYRKKRMISREGIRPQLDAVLDLKK